MINGSLNVIQYVKSVRIRSYSGPHFPAFGLNTERYGVSLCIDSECGKIRTRIDPNTDTFNAGIPTTANWIKIVLKIVPKLVLTKVTKA